jgi:hypothetical protein
VAYAIQLLDRPRQEMVEMLAQLLMPAQFGTRTDVRYVFIVREFRMIAILI